MNEKPKLKLSLAQITAPGFAEALQKLRRQPLGREAYAVGKSIRTIEGELRDYSEAFASIVKEHGKEIRPGEWTVDVANTEHHEAAKKEIAELQAQEFEIFLDHKIKLPDIGPLQDAMNATSAKLMAAAANASPEQILQSAGIFSQIINEFRGLILTPDDAIVLEPLIEA